MRILHVITQLDKVYGAQSHVVESVRNEVDKFPFKIQAILNV